eukprot:1506413-Pyramimonas_sp.AAC.1
MFLSEGFNQTFNTLDNSGAITACFAFGAALGSLSNYGGECLGKMCSVLEIFFEMAKVPVYFSVTPLANRSLHRSTLQEVV